MDGLNKVPRQAEEPRRSMDQAETIDFLRSQGVDELEDWRFGPVLYVLPDVIRRDWAETWGVTYEDAPSVVRFEAPNALNFNAEYQKGDEGGVRGKIRNAGDRLDYYAIDRKTKRRTLVRTAKMGLNVVKNYAIKSAYLYKADDELFPRGPEVVDQYE